MHLFALNSSGAAHGAALRRPNRRRIRSAGWGCWCLLVLLASPLTRVHAQALVTHEAASSVGLERAWFAQLPVDRERSRVSRWTYDGDHLFAVTTSGTLAAVDASTGATRWTARVGKPGYPAFGPGANAIYVAAVSGSQLYVFNRQDGRLVWSRELGSAPATGPALTERHAFVALMNGQIEAYELDNPEKQPWYYQSKGRTFQRPTTTGTVVSWPTDSGLLYVSSADSPNVLFRLETNDEIVTSPAEYPPYLYIASLDGYLYAINEMTGRERWKFSTGRPITSSPALVDGVAYVASIEPALYAVDAETGQQKWRADHAHDFVAVSRERVYATDSFGTLLALSQKTGAVEGRLPLGENVTALVNDQTDRILLITPSGLLQCLHEIGQSEPIRHRRPQAAATDEASGEGENPFAIEPPAAEENPFAAGADDEAAAEPAPEDEAPEGEGPGDAQPAIENPFGDFGF